MPTRRDRLPGGLGSLSRHGVLRRCRHDDDAARCHVCAEGAHEFAGVGNVLDDLGGENHIESLIERRLGGHVLVEDLDAQLARAPPRRGGGFDTDRAPSQDISRIAHHEPEVRAHLEQAGPSRRIDAIEVREHRVDAGLGLHVPVDGLVGGGELHRTAVNGDAAADAAPGSRQRRAESALPVEDVLRLAGATARNAGRVRRTGCPSELHDPTLARAARAHCRPSHRLRLVDMTGARRRRVGRAASPAPACAPDSRPSARRVTE